MALTKEKNIAIAAMNAKGMCIEAIAKKAGINKDEVRESLENKGRSYIELGIMSKEEKTEYIKELGRNGKAIVDIMELTGLGKTSVYNYLFGDKDKKCPAKPSQINEDFDKAVNEMITEAKKEPAPAATDTSSSNENINSLYPNDSTDEPKSQEPEPEMCPEWLLATTEDMLFIYNSMTEAEQRAWDLGQIYGRIAHERARYV